MLGLSFSWEVTLGIRQVHSEEQVVAGLQLYVATNKMLSQVFEPTDAALIEQTVMLIEAELK
jgi:hypothetical protein